MTERVIDLPRRRFGRPARTAAGERIYAIGDVHGQLDLFGDLMRRIKEHNSVRPRARVRMIVLGDVIDRGPSSKSLLELLRNASLTTGEVTILLGNHEAALLDAVSGDAAAQDIWLRFGGLDTLASYGVEPPREDEDRFAFARRLADSIGLDILEWLQELPLTTRSGDYFFCHAGVRPGVSIARQSRDDLLWIRDDFMQSSREHGAVIVHGHSVVDEVEVRPNRISIDTGAYRTGVLSAVCLEESRGWLLSTEAKAVLADRSEFTEEGRPLQRR